MQSLTQLPVVGILPHLPHLDDLEKLAQVVSDWDLEALGLGFGQLLVTS
jgi:dethiobiotin synthetase